MDAFIQTLLIASDYKISRMSMASIYYDEAALNLADIPSSRTNHSLPSSRTSTVQDREA